MKLRVLLFASLRERAGAAQLELELPAGARVADALERLGWLTDGTRVVMAVNREYAASDRALGPGDELALIPPVSGGAEPAGMGGAGPAGMGGAGPAGMGGAGAAAAGGERPVHARITAQPLALEPLLERVRDPRAGAVVTFHGVTREVPALEYEAYSEMAGAKLAEILAAAVQRHGLCAAAAEHRVGTVALGEPSVIVVTSAPHRAEAFAGAREIIDQVKAQAPIWKREEGEWVRGAIPRPDR